LWIHGETGPEKERPEYVKAEFQEKIAPLDPVKWLPKLKTSSIRLQFIDADTVTPTAARQKIEEVVPKQARVADFKDGQAFAAANPGGAGLDWLKTTLQPDFVHDYAAHDAEPGALGSEKKVQR